MTPRRGYGSPLRGHARTRRRTLESNTEPLGDALADLLAAQAASLSPRASQAALTIPQARRTGALRPGDAALAQWCATETDQLTLAHLNARTDLGSESRRALARRYPPAMLALAYEDDPWATEHLYILSKWTLRGAFNAIAASPIPPGPISQLLANNLAVGDLGALTAASHSDAETAAIIVRRLRGINPPADVQRAAAMLVAVAALARHPWPEQVRSTLVRWLDWFFAPQPDGTLTPRCDRTDRDATWPAAPSTDERPDCDRAIRFAAVARAVLTDAFPLSEGVDVGFYGLFTPLCGLYCRAITAAITSGEYARACAWARATETRGYGFVSVEHGLLSSGDLGPDVRLFPEDLAAALMTVAAPDAIEVLLDNRACGNDEEAYARAILCHPASTVRHLAAVPAVLRHRLLGEVDIARRFVDQEDLPIDDVLACPALTVFLYCENPELAETVLALLDYRTDALAVLASCRADATVTLRAACTTALAAVTDHRASARNE